jgi:DNA repair exonuclease SbcCD ATPase subunit
MPKTENTQPKDEAGVVEKPKAKTKRLTVKTVWSEVDALKQSLAALDAKTTSTGHLLEGLSPKIEATRSASANDAQGAQQMASLTAGMQSLNGNYLRQVEEQSSLRRDIKDMGSKVDSLTAGTKLVEESCGELSIDVDALKESIDKTAKKTEALEAAVVKLEGNLKRAYWITGLAIGAVAIVVIIVAMVLL